MALVELREILTEGDRRAVLGLRRGHDRCGRRLPADPARRRHAVHELRRRARFAPRLYLRYGFADTGRVMWGENVLALDLRRART